MSRLPDPERDEEFLAADYALGTLEAPERRLAERRMRGDPRFAEEVLGWENRLGAMAQAVAPQPVPEHVWAAILADLPPVRVAAAPRPGESAADAVSRGVSRLWKWLALGSSAVAAASLAALLFLAVPLGPAQPVGDAASSFAAALAGEDGAPIYAAVLDPATGSATLLPLTVAAGAGREGGSQELWLVPAGGAPISLGLLDPDQPLRLRLDPQFFGQEAGGALAVSQEPAGGSPTGQPTGPVFAQGALRSI